MSISDQIGPSIPRNPPKAPKAPFALHEKVRIRPNCMGGMRSQKYTKGEVTGVDLRSGNPWVLFVHDTNKTPHPNGTMAVVAKFLEADTGNRRRLPCTSSVALNRIRRLRRRLAFETSEYEKMY